MVTINLSSIRVDKDKISRALPVASRAEAGKVKLVRGNWISDFIDEATSFPHGAHDDQIDAVSGAFQMIAAPAGSLELLDEELADAIGNYRPGRDNYDPPYGTAATGRQR
jgi:phage terminase large subunit-like protein